MKHFCVDVVDLKEFEIPNKFQEFEFDSFFFFLSSIFDLLAYRINVVDVILLLQV